MPPNQDPTVSPQNDNQVPAPEPVVDYAQQPVNNSAQPLPVQPSPINDTAQPGQPIAPDQNYATQTAPQPQPATPPPNQGPLPTPAPQAPLSSSAPSSLPTDPNQAGGFPPPQQPQSFNSKPKKKILKKVLIILPILIVIVIGVIFAPGLLSGDAKYSKLATASNKHERETDPKFSVDYPAEMKEVYRSAFTVEYEDRDPKEGERANIEVQSQYVGKRSMEETKSKIKESLLAGSGEVYDAVLKAASDDSVANNVKFGKFTEFTNSSVKDALSVTYTYDAKRTTISGSGSSDKDVPVKGQAIMAFGEEHIYTLDISAVAKVWDKNEKVFKQILNSFKIDL